MSRGTKRDLLIAAGALRTIALMVLVILTSCSGTPTSRDSERSSAGLATLYVLRPAFSDVSRKDTPTFYINDRKAASLVFGAYTDFKLAPGTYKLSVLPGTSVSSVWSGDWQLDVEADEKYFLAIWNGVEYRQEVKGFLLLPFPYVSTEGHNSALRHELVAEKEAMPVIETLKRVKPLATSFELLP
jgi:hypothetical protein